MKRFATFGVALAAVLAGGVLIAPPASAATLHVHPGESIQAAVNAARWGDVVVVHPGTYLESVHVRKSGVTLRGSGADSDGTVLRPPAAGSANCALCLGDFNPNTFQVRSQTRDITVSGFMSNGFGIGILALDSHYLTVMHNTALNAAEYAIAAFDLSHASIAYNRAFDSGEAGIYVGDSPNADVVIQGNTTAGNGVGIFLRDSRTGTVVGNDVFHNCAGIVNLDTGAPVWAGYYDIRDNEVATDNEVCPSDGDEPGLSGVGILVAGGKGNTIRYNTVWNHKAAAESIASGGIVLLWASDDGGHKATDNAVRTNTLFGNKPLDLHWDGYGTGNTFSGNNCDTSFPEGMCS